MAVENLAALGGEFRREGFRGIGAGCVVGHHAHHFLDAVLRRPVGHRHGRLREREARPRDIGRLLGDDRGARRGDDFRRLGFGGERRNGHRRGRDAEAGEEGHLVVDDQVLRDALGIVRNSAVVLDDEFDFLAGNSVAVLLPCKAWPPAASCLPVDCCWPVIGRMKPILTCLRACAALAAAAIAMAALAASKKFLNFIEFLPEPLNWIGDWRAYQHLTPALSS